MINHISRMYTLSTTHILPSTYALLKHEPETNLIPSLGVYRKGEYGLFVYIAGDLAEGMNPMCLPMPDIAGKSALGKNFPEDLIRCLRYAWNKGCEVVCFDSDGPIVESIPSYPDAWENL